MVVVKLFVEALKPNPWSILIDDDVPLVINGINKFVEVLSAVSDTVDASVADAIFPVISAYVDAALVWVKYVDAALVWLKYVDAANVVVK